MSGVSVLYCPMAFLDIRPISFQNQMFWGLLFPKVQKFEVPNVGHSSLTPKKKEVQYYEIAPNYGSLLGWGFGKAMSLPLLPIMMWSFILCNGGACSGGFQVFFRGNFPHVAINLFCP